MPPLDGFIGIGEVLKSGVYALVYRGSVVYIGKSKNILTRLYTHRSMWVARRRGRTLRKITTPGILFDDVMICPCPEHEMGALEVALIKRLRPKHNTVHNTGERKLDVPKNFVLQGVVLNRPAAAKVMTRRL